MTETLIATPDPEPDHNRQEQIRRILVEERLYLQTLAREASVLKLGNLATKAIVNHGVVSQGIRHRNYASRYSSLN